MAHESFEDEEIAEILNKNFISIKVDKEQRPDVDTIYMAVCQAYTGNGGWPTSIFMTAEQKPFFAGTYFPKTSRYGMIGFRELLFTIQKKWQTDRERLLHSANEITEILKQRQLPSSQANRTILEQAMALYQQSFDQELGGFGEAPKFPAPHNLLFLMKHYQKTGDGQALQMAEKTLLQMYKGGMFDHIGYGFCRYSTDRYYCVPHFEKMLYDNALLMLAYCKAFEITKNAFYKKVAEQIGFYILTEMTSEEGSFFSAQDADSDGVEGKYYVFVPQEISELLGENDSKAFNSYYNITEEGNFEGKSIPNLLYTKVFSDEFEGFLPKIREYRRQRCSLYTDDKILTTWNALMIGGFCALYRISKNEKYLEAAKKSYRFIEQELCEKDTLYVSFRHGMRGEKGFLDDYAFYAYALLGLYDVTLDRKYLDRANTMAGKAIDAFFDTANGGFYLYGKENESLIFRPKESYDGAIPSGNSMMAYILVRLNALNPRKEIEGILKKQLDFVSGEAEKYPAGYAMFLMALSDYFEPPMSITVVMKDKDIPLPILPEGNVTVLTKPTEEYKLIDEKTTYYVCKNHSCLPPVNQLEV